MRALRSCSGDVHVARVVVSLVVHAVVGLTLGLIHDSCCCRRFRRSVSVANFLYFEVYFPRGQVDFREIGCENTSHVLEEKKFKLRIPLVMPGVIVGT